MLKEHRGVLPIIGAILALRLAFTFLYPIAQISDYQGYYNGALAVSGLRPESLSSWDPLGPKLFYALPLRLVGGDVRVLGLVNAFVFALGVAALYCGARSAFDEPTARLAAGLSLVSLSDLYFNNLACTEVLAGLSLNVLFCLLSKPLSRSGLVLVGLTLGLASYNRSNMMALGASLLVVEWFRSKRKTHALSRTALAGGTTLVVLLPLSLFNDWQFGRFTPMTSNTGVQVWYGNNPDASPGSHKFLRLPEEFPQGSAERTRLAGLYRDFLPSAGQEKSITAEDPYSFSDVGARYGIAWIRKNGPRYRLFVVGRAQQMYSQCTYGVAPYLFYNPALPEQPAWTPWARAALLGEAPVRLLDGPPNPLTRLNRFVGYSYKVLALGSLTGLLLTLAHLLVTRTNFNRLIPALMLLIYSVPFFLTIALNRYHIPILGLMWIYLAHGLVLLTRAVRAPLAPSDRNGISA